VFFWSDHGDGLPRGKRWTYDSGTEVPMIIRWPGYIKPGSVIDRMISSIDFGPTVLSMAGIRKPYHMQGKSFLGKYEEDPRLFAFSARDRFDESYDMVRSVRDKRYRYVRNFYPNEPYIVWVPYRNTSPIMQELLRLHAEDKLEGPQKLWFSETRPPEELYDCEADPYQINNVIDDPGYASTLNRMRLAMNTWRMASRDMGDISEYAMKEMMWPGGEQPETAPPHFVPNAPGNRNKEMTDQGGTFDGPMTLSLYCATQGASIAYTLEEGEDDVQWLLYNGPIRLKNGTTTVRAKAIRYGFKHSEEVEAVFEVE
jgi:hypothetical protein